MAMRRDLLPLATLLTPNVPEAEALTGLALSPTTPPRASAAQALLDLGAPAVLLKGGHLSRGGGAGRFGDARPASR